MQLSRLRLRGFRNLEPLDLPLAPGITVFWGDNGQGKTNLLEAVYLLATLKSFRAAKNSEMVRHGEAVGTVEGRLLSQGLPRDLSVQLGKTGRRVRLDGKSPRSLTGYFDTIKAVGFVPGDLRLVDGAPDGRRAFLDRAAFTADAGHLASVKRYGDALKHKNALLRAMQRGRRVGAEELSVWNAQVVSTGAELVGRRLAFLTDFMPIFRELHEAITGSAKGHAELRYRSCAGPDARGMGPAALQAELATRIAAAAEVEQRRGFSTVGPHRDDWELRVGGEALRAFGSQGQVRSAALALRVAEVVLARQRSGRTPLFLLDDVGSELDPHRNARLMDLLGELQAQVLVTTTEVSNLKLDPGAYTAFHVEQGRVG